LPEKYFLQMQWQMACTGRQWCDFASYDPRLPESMRLHVDRVKRDDDAIKAIERDVADFLNELRDTVHALRKRYEPEGIDTSPLHDRLDASVTAGASHPDRPAPSVLCR